MYYTGPRRAPKLSAEALKGLYITRTIPSRKAGKCAFCGAPTSEGNAFACVDGDGAWRSFCATTGCMPRMALGMVERLREDRAREEERANLRELREDGTLVMPFEREALPLLRAMPGARWDPGAKVWRVDVGEGRAETLRLARELRLHIAPALTYVAPDPEEVTRAVERARAAGAYPFQLEGVAFLANPNHPRRLLGDEMGTGKTVQALLALPDSAPVLLVVPAALKRNWANEFARWRPDYTVTVLQGRGAFAWPKAGQAVIINPEILPRAKAEGEGAAKAYKLPAELEASAPAGLCVIADEAHAYKSAKAARSHNMAALASVGSRVWCMTGTPLLNRAPDLWGLLRTFGLHRVTFGGYKTFKRLFSAVANGYGGYEWGTATPEVPARLRRVMLRRLRADVLPELPGKTHQTVPVPVSALLTKDMDKLWGAGLQGQELPPFEKFSRVRKDLADAKQSVAEEIAATYEEEGTPLVVACAHVAPVVALGQREGWRAITGATSAEERAEIVEAFQAGELKGLALTIKAGGVGLTLTHAAHMLFVDLEWNPSLNVQCEDRLARIGQTAEGCVYTVLVADHPLEHHITALLLEKAAKNHAAIDAAPALPEDVTAHAPAGASTELGAVPEVAATVAEVRKHTVLLPVLAEESAEQAAARRALHLGEGPQHLVHAAKVKKALAKIRETHGEPEVPPADLRAAIAQALDSMVARCDGAQERDFAGFNKADVERSRWLQGADIAGDAEAATLALHMLRRYPRQLREDHPALFEPRGVKEVTYREVTTRPATASEVEAAPKATPPAKLHTAEIRALAQRQHSALAALLARI